MHHLINFFNSSFFIAIVTLIVGSYALYLYRKQKVDKKREAANVIWLEITNAERVLKSAKSSIFSSTNAVLPDTLFAMKTESWSKFNYLFVNDFDRDEWDTITDFYNKCKLYDEAVTYNNSSFAKNEEQIRVNNQRILTEFAHRCAEELEPEINATKRKQIEKRYQNLKNEFIDVYMTRQQFVYLYAPAKPINDAKSYLQTLTLDLATSPIGSKLKKLARIKANQS